MQQDLSSISIFIWEDTKKERLENPSYKGDIHVAHCIRGYLRMFFADIIHCLLYGQKQRSVTRVSDITEYFNSCKITKLGDISMIIHYKKAPPALGFVYFLSTNQLPPYTPLLYLSFQIIQDTLSSRESDST